MEYKSTGLNWFLLALVVVEDALVLLLFSHAHVQKVLEQERGKSVLGRFLMYGVCCGIA
jgi:hypothetical protein